MVDILKTIKEELPGIRITDAIFEGANIVLYTADKEFFKEGENKIKEIVSKLKKRIELRADQSILFSEAETEKTIRALVPEEAEIVSIIFENLRNFILPMPIGISFDNANYFCFRMNISTNQFEIM